MKPEPIGQPHIRFNAVETTDHKYLSFYQTTTVTGNARVAGLTAQVREFTSPNEQNRLVVFTKNDVTYYFESRNYQKDPNQSQVFDQILSTFKFSTP